jgi:hypothetical protein
MFEMVVIVIVVTGIGMWVYREGKRFGSKKAYGVGLRRGRQR